ncbi:hypothetical protein [Deinococcus hohokamensis]|uniref:Uncharacterized protein n=1 Tax=Deinococcus hohokamensis TaxID=309883 RepID=A0ABV9I8R3_9DEIO
MTRPTPALLGSLQDRVTYQAGQNTFSGMTTVTVDGSGQVKVTYRRGKTNQEYRGRLNGAQRQTLTAALKAATPPPEPAPAYQPTADEARIQVQVVTGGQTRTLVFWQNQATQREALQDLIDAFQALAKAVSKGKVRY